jgi:hypothetical protein
MLRWSWMCVLVAASLAGCSGGGGAGPSAAFSVTVVSSSPSDNASGVPVQPAEVRVRFNNDLDPSTVTTANVRLEDLGAGSGVVPGTVSYTASTREVVWTLTQADLNPLLPGAVAFAYDNPYRLVVTKGVKSAQGPEITASVSLDFRTELAQLGIAASEPKASTTTALVEPYTIFLPNSASMEAIVTVVLNVDVDPQTVTNTALVRLDDMTGGTPVALQNAKVSYDAPTRTLGWTMTAAQTGGLANVTFTGEPLLRFDTDYRLTIDKSVPMVVTAGTFISAVDLTLDFRTAKFVGAPAAPANGTESTQVLINEVHADVDTSTPDADANRDGAGAFDASWDEFVEILNLTGDYIDLSEHVISDVSAGCNEAKFLVFPGTTSTPDRLSLLPPRRAIVFLSGKNPNRTPDLRAMGIGRSKLIAGPGVPGGQGGLNNSGGDDVRLYLPSAANPPTSTVLSTMLFRSACSGNVTAATDQSMNRTPDGTPGVDNYTGHSTVSPGGLIQSAGVRADGTIFE